MNRRIAGFLFLLISVSSFVPNLHSQEGTAAKQPVAPVRPVTDDYYGTKIVDNYRYMENLKDPEVQKWMKAQADYTHAMLDSLPGRASLLARINDVIRSQPARVVDVQIVAGHYYSQRTPSGSQVAGLYVRDGLKGADRLLIDPQKDSDSREKHSSISFYAPSPDNRYVAYGLSSGGSENAVLHVFDIAEGKDTAESIDRARFAPPSRRTSVARTRPDSDRQRVSMVLRSGSGTGSGIYAKLANGAA